MKTFSQIFESFHLTLAYHNELNPTLWDGQELRPGLISYVFQHMQAFLKMSGVDNKLVHDVVFTGSSANFNYTKYSDIDIHIVTDVAGMDTDHLYDMKVKWTNENALFYKGLPVEFYVHDSRESMPSDQGMYSLKYQKWIHQPTHMDHIDDLLNSPSTLNRAKHAIQTVRALLRSPNSRNAILHFKTKMWKGRTAGLAREGEFSLENIVYKDLRNRGLVEKLNAKLKDSSGVS